jgi:hypothetical protein
VGVGVVEGVIGVRIGPFDGGVIDVVIGIVTDGCCLEVFLDFDEVFLFDENWSLVI